MLSRALETIHTDMHANSVGWPVSRWYAIDENV